MSAVQEIDKKTSGTAALGFSQQVDLGAGRTGVFQTHLPSDCTLAELNGMLDKMCAASDRLRAHYKIEERERDVDLLVNEQAQHDEDMAKADERFEIEQARLRDHLLKQETARTNFMVVKEEEHAASGRRGKFEPKGAEKTQVNAVDAGVEKIKQGIARNKAEHDITHAKHAELKTRRGELVAKHQREIAKCQEIMARGLEAAV